MQGDGAYPFFHMDNCDFLTLWTPPRELPPGLSLRAPHLACGGVPGSPTAPSPEGQALQESLLIEESCSSGACSSPAPHRQGDQGNILRLRGGEGSAGQHLWAPRRQGLSLSPPRPSPAPRGPHAAQPLGTALPFPASPSR